MWDKCDNLTQTMEVLMRGKLLHVKCCDGFKIVRQVKKWQSNDTVFVTHCVVILQEGTWRGTQ